MPGDHPWRAAKTKAVCFEDGFHARGYIVKTNDSLARGGEISNVSKVTPLVEFGIKIPRGSSSKWES